MSNQPIVFNVRFTPYGLPRNANAFQRKKHEKDRKFYDLSGERNLLSYITQGKKVGESKTFLDYLQKNTGVFNDKGIITEEQLVEMKERLSKNKGNIWHGYISVDEENSEKIDTPEKCIAFVKRTFGSFLDEMHLRRDNIDLMCALHLDRPNHLHIHFSFWEKAPTYKGKDGTLHYRGKGKVDKAAIDNMFVRAGLFVSDEKDELPMTRKEAIKALRGMTHVKRAMSSKEEIKKEILALAKELPKDSTFGYENKACEPFRERVDRIVNMLLDHDGEADVANRRFLEALTKRKIEIGNICGNPFAFTNGSKTDEEVWKDLPKYHFQVDKENIKIVEKIEADYKRRQGNLVLNLARFIKPEYYERDKSRQYKSNDKALKKLIRMSDQKIGNLFQQFFASFGKECRLLERDYCNRLQEIEKEIEKEKKKEEGKKD